MRFIKKKQQHKALVVDHDLTRLWLTRCDIGNENYANEFSNFSGSSTSGQSALHLSGRRVAWKHRFLLISLELHLLRYPFSLSYWRFQSNISPPNTCLIHLNSNSPSFSSLLSRPVTLSIYWILFHIIMSTEYMFIYYNITLLTTV